MRPPIFFVLLVSGNPSYVWLWRLPMCHLSVSVNLDITFYLTFFHIGLCIQVTNKLKQCASSFLILCLPRQVHKSNAAICQVVWLSRSTCCNPSSSSPITSFSVLLLPFPLHSFLNYSSQKGISLVMRPNHFLCRLWIINITRIL